MKKKIVLAYSGGLDTSIILKWLKENYNAEVITYTADIGQGQELETVKLKAASLGVKEIYIENLKEEVGKQAAWSFEIALVSVASLLKYKYFSFILIY